MTGLHCVEQAATGSTELRGWLTLAWALFVGSGTLIGEYAAVRSYLSSNWERKVAVARKVFIKGNWYSHHAKDGEPVGGHYANRGADLLTLAPGTVFDERVAIEDLTSFNVEVHNGSDEPIGNISVMATTDDKEVLGRYDLGALAPGAVGQQGFLIRNGSNASLDFSALYLEFTDSAGNRWQRHETDPPRPFSKRTRKQIKKDRKPIQPDPYVS